MNGHLVKPISELSVDDVGTVLEAFDLSEYREIFTKNKIDGNSLFECSTVDDVKEMGISLNVKAKYFLKLIDSLQQQQQQLIGVDDGSEVDDDDLLHRAAEVQMMMMMPTMVTHTDELFFI